MPPPLSAPLTDRERALVAALRVNLDLPPEKPDELVLRVAPDLLGLVGRERQEYRELRGAALEIHHAVIDTLAEVVFDNELTPERLRRDAATITRALCELAAARVSLRAIRAALPPEATR